MSMKSMCLVPCVAALLATSAFAAEIAVSADLTGSVSWTRDNVYRLKNTVYALPGCTVTIEAGTVIASDPGVAGANPGALVITRGAMLDCQGTVTDPIIFTSYADYLTWTPTNPRGVWRAGAGEWGNLTILGKGYIGKYGGNAPAGNVASPSGSNVQLMEGLTGTVGGDTRGFYGGSQDDDDSGSLRYTNFRYGGFILTSGGVELNGISLGGVGQGTEIDHIEIMNNIDDGIEIWGGKVNLKYFSIWNIGDDSIDVDQGWRGQAQFGLIVGGYSRNAAAGSGVGDSLIEADGAERADAQPVGTVSMYNLTLIGQPDAGNSRHGIKYRDNMNLQIGNSIIMDVPREVVRNDVGDGEANNGGSTSSGFGYGYNGTLSFASRWSTNWDVFSTVNPFAGAYTPAMAYTGQSSGKLNQITDTVFWNNVHSSAYTTADSVNVRAAANNNVTAAASPITRITRGTVTLSSFTTGLIKPVLGLDPRPVSGGAAETAVNAAPSTCFFTPVTYRGAFSPDANKNWLAGWSTSYQFGYVGNWNGASYDALPLPCAGDLDGSGSVDAGDIGSLLVLFGDCSACGECEGDLDGSRSVDSGDIGNLLVLFGDC
jgi:hypothetical protein